MVQEGYKLEALLESVLFVDQQLVQMFVMLPTCDADNVLLALCCFLMSSLYAQRTLWL